MKVSEFGFDLPPDLIAQHPASPRDSARLLHVSSASGGGFGDGVVNGLPALLRPGDILVVNDTRVMPSRLRGTRVRDGGGTGAGVEVTLLGPAPGGGWRALARPARKLGPGDVVVFASGLEATVAAKGEAGGVTLDFALAPAEVVAKLDIHGQMPLPPYIRRPKDGLARDRDDYQTLFADRPGAVAAPTAGLHFTERLMAALAARGVGLAQVTLHVGEGTFLPVTADDTRCHVMHGEWGEISAGSAQAVNDAKSAGGRVVAVGSTSLRLLESAADGGGTIAPFRGETDLFITPGYEFKIVEAMITNFHLPKSTLFMLVSAFAGRRRMKAAYGHAIAAGYRFYSYGDCCLLDRAPPP